MKTVIMMLLMISLVGCRSFERALVCNEVEENKLGEMLMCHYSVKFDKCKCKMINLDNYTEITSLTEYPLSYCDGLAGFKTESWGEDIGPKLRALSRLKEERCK